MATTETARVDLLTVARDMADQLGLPPIGSKDPVYGLTAPGNWSWLELSGRPGLAEALILTLAEHLETLPGRPRALYLTQGGISCEPGYGGHSSYTIGWYDEPLRYDPIEGSLMRRAGRLHDRLAAAPGMSG